MPDISASPFTQGNIFELCFQYINGGQPADAARASIGIDFGNANHLEATLVPVMTGRWTQNAARASSAKSENKNLDR